MKHLINKSLYFLCVLNALCIVASCKKSNSVKGTSALTIVNIIPGSNNLVTNFFAPQPGGKEQDTLMWYASAAEIGYGRYAELGSYSGNTKLSLSQISDTLQSICDVTLNLQISRIYSFFLTGTDTLHVDTLLTQDQIPYFPYTGDSLTGIRFVNLVTGSNPITIDIQGNPNTTMVGSLPYKGITAFTNLSANTNAQNNGYLFEFRDAISDSVLATYSLNINLLRSQTLAFYGSLSSGLSVMEINNF
jgi:hypothetical protein